MNLREKPSADAPVVTRLRIASPCEVRGEKNADGWVPVSCDGAEGFLKLQFLGTEAPRAEKLLADARDDGKPITERLGAAERAVALAPDDTAAHALLKATFLRAELEELRKIRAGGKGPKATVSKFKCADGTELKDCAGKELGKAKHAVATAVEVDAADMIVASLGPDGALDVVGGVASRDGAKAQLSVEMTHHSKASEPLMIALLGRSGGPAFDALPHAWINWVTEGPRGPHIPDYCDSDTASISLLVEQGVPKLMGCGGNDCEPRRVIAARAVEGNYVFETEHGDVVFRWIDKPRGIAGVTGLDFFGGKEWTFIDASRRKKVKTIKYPCDSGD